MSSCSVEWGGFVLNVDYERDVFEGEETISLLRVYHFDLTRDVCILPFLPKQTQDEIVQLVWKELEQDGD